MAEADEAFRRALQLDDANWTLVCQYNEFRISHWQELPADRARYLVGGGAAAGLGLTYWGAALRALGDVIFYGDVPSGAPRQSSFLSLAAEESFTDLVRRLPHGWEPELVIHLTPEFNFVPPGMAGSPFPTLAMVQDPYPRPSSLLAVLDQFDLVGVFDEELLPQFDRITDGRAIYTPGNGLNHFFVKPITGVREKYDLVFLGSIDGSAGSPDYIPRDRLIRKLERLSERYSILISNDLGDPGEHGPNYVHTLNETRIGLCCTHTQKIHPTLCEIMGAGKLAFINAGNRTVERAFVPGEDLVVYTEDDFEEKLSYYLSHPDERRRIAANGFRKVTEGYTFVHQLSRAIASSRDALAARPGLDSRPALQASREANLLAEGVSAYFSVCLPAALKAFQAAALVKGQYAADAHNNLAILCLAARSDLADPAAAALAQLDVALDRDPHHIVSLFNRYHIALRHQGIDDQACLSNLLQLLAQPMTCARIAHSFALIYYPELEHVEPPPSFFPGSYFGAAWARLQLQLRARQANASADVARFLQGRLHHVRGEAFLAEKEWAEGLHSFQAAAALGYSDPRLYFALGEAAAAVGDEAASSDAYRRALELRPLYGEAEARLASCQ